MDITLLLEGREETEYLKLLSNRDTKQQKSKRKKQKKPFINTYRKALLAPAAHQIVGGVIGVKVLGLAMIIGV